MPIHARWAAAVRPYVAAACSGLMLTAAFPDPSLSVLAFVALVPLLTVVAGRRPAEAFRFGLFAGMVHYGTLLAWVVYTMGTYGQLPLFISVPVLGLLAVYLSLYPAAFAALLVRQRIAMWALAPAAGALWTALEFLRAHLLTGFPWELLGYSQYHRLRLIQMADVTGVYGLSFLIVTINAGVFLLYWKLRQRSWQGRGVTFRAAGAAVGVALLCLGGAIGYGQWCLNRMDALITTAPQSTVAIVQGNIDQARKWDPAFQTASVDKYLGLSLKVLGGSPDLVVWPETATPFYLHDPSALADQVIRFVRSAHVPFLLGSPFYQERGGKIHYFNSAYLLNADGRMGGRYDKVHLVPFGEYVPLRRLLPFVGKMVPQVGDFKPGRQGTVLPWGDRQIGVQICYEIIFPSLARHMTSNGADLLVNITNDAWFGRTAAPQQHFSMAVFRAVENRRALVRAANTGISGFIAPDGKILARTGLFTDAALSHPVPLLNRQTLYTRFGDAWAWGCLLVSAVMIGGDGIFRKRR
ncbi:MAG: apolipoprotein N-acyltransferase [Desulfobacterales bacterium]|nr:apolipoprotein N-acyltransferase [Desulfobacterales bacterium]